MGNLWTSFFPKRLPVIVILGATGSGKSKLAIELAEKFNGEIISADSMQVYKGLDIITNKVSDAEQHNIPHHFLGFLDPLSRFTVVDFRNRALKIIYRLLERGKLPVIVGGTNYYIESLLWNVLVDSEREDNSDNKLLFELDEFALKNPSGSCTTLVNERNNFKPINSLNDCKLLEKLPQGISDDIFSSKITSDSLKHIPCEQLHHILSKVDSDFAKKVHPHHYRKIVRALQVYQKYGRPYSSIINEQCNSTGGSSLGGSLRFTHSCILWLKCEQSVLNERLDKRVEQMLVDGLIKELLDFHESYNHIRIGQNLEADYTIGIFQAIGFKEFHEYLILNKDERESKKGQKLLKEGIAALKQKTQYYSKQQLKWIRNRFLKKPDRQVPPIFDLDATESQFWDEKVLQPATNIVHSLIQNRVPAINPVLPMEGKVITKDTYFCDICQRSFVGSDIWEIHLKSRKHYRVKKKLKLLEEKKSIASQN